MHCLTVNVAFRADKMMMITCFGEVTLSTLTSEFLLFSFFWLETPHESDV